MNTPTMMDSTAAVRPIRSAERGHGEAGLGGIESRQAGASTVIVCRGNCALSPRQLLIALALAMAISLLVATGFLLAGAPWVLPFSCVELILLAAAFLWVARHAGDHQSLTVTAREVIVETVSSSSLRRVVFDRAWLQVRRDAQHAGLIELRGGGQQLLLGRQLAWPARQALTRTLDQALKRWPAAAGEPEQSYQST